MKKIYLSAVFFIALSAGAQNLNPTVSVTRDYEGKLMEVHKPSIPFSRIRTREHTISSLTCWKCVRMLNHIQAGNCI